MADDFHEKEDKLFFKKAMAGIKRSHLPNSIRKEKPVLKQSRHVKLNSFNSPPLFPFSDKWEETTQSEEILRFIRNNELPRKTITNFTKGRIRPNIDVDLHALTIEQARVEITNFLQEAVNEGYRCVRIIHGKGKFSKNGPVLKNYVNTWLRQHEAVLGFASCISADGGTGAVYVLLRRRKFGKTSD